MFSGAGLGKKCVEGIIAATYGLITGHLTIRLNAVLKAKQFPASIADLNACLADVNAKSLTHCCWRGVGL